MNANERTPRVFVVVSGGNAYVATEGNVEVSIFDCDNYRADSVNTDKVPEGFADLARKLGVEADAIYMPKNVVVRRDQA